MIDIHELKKQCPDYSFLHMDTVGSTNEYLKEHLDLPEKTVVIAEEQTRGKGRKGRSFYSPKGCGIYLSLLIKPQDSLDSVFDLTAITALSALKAIQTIYGITPSIKWLNDLLVHGQKIAGILCESLFFGSQIKAMILGIGINVHAFERPAEIASVAASIEDFSPIKKPRSILIALMSTRKSTFIRLAKFLPGLFEESMIIFICLSKTNTVNKSCWFLLRFRFVPGSSREAVWHTLLDPVDLGRPNQWAFHIRS